MKIKTLNDISLQTLRTSIRGKKMIGNTFNYDILMNQVYADMFFYQFMEKRKENESSDMVAKIIYMGEFSLDQHQQLEVKSNTEFL